MDPKHYCQMQCSHCARRCGPSACVKVSQLHGSDNPLRLICGPWPYSPQPIIGNNTRHAAAHHCNRTQVYSRICRPLIRRRSRQWRPIFCAPSFAADVILPKSRPEKNNCFAGRSPLHTRDSCAISHLRCVRLTSASISRGGIVCLETNLSDTTLKK
jgi:hypothetical protein